VRRVGAVGVVLLGVIVVSCSSSGGPAKGSSPGVDPKDPLAATMLMQQAQDLLNGGDAAQAVVKLNEALALQPKNPTILNFLGLAELRRGNGVKALECFNRALDLAPAYTDARNNRGVTYRQLGQPAMAEVDFLAVLTDSTYANRAGTLLNLGALYMSQGNYEAAQTNLHKSTRLYGPAEAYHMLGQVEQHLGHAELAEKNLMEAVTRQPDRVDYMLSLAEFLDGAGRREEAGEYFRKILATRPNSPEADKARVALGR
jgi:type IV pilus assembly protein PilF